MVFVVVVVVVVEVVNQSSRSPAAARLRSNRAGCTAGWRPAVWCQVGSARAGAVWRAAQGAARGFKLHQAAAHGVGHDLGKVLRPVAQVAPAAHGFPGFAQGRSLGAVVGVGLGGPRGGGHLPPPLVGRRGTTTGAMPGSSSWAAFSFWAASRSSRRTRAKVLLMSVSARAAVAKRLVVDAHAGPGDFGAGAVVHGEPFRVGGLIRVRACGARQRGARTPSSARCGRCRRRLRVLMALLTLLISIKRRDLLVRSTFFSSAITGTCWRWAEAFSTNSLRLTAISLASRRR